jgi:hypothetical protein
MSGAPHQPSHQRVQPGMRPGPRQRVVFDGFDGTAQQLAADAKLLSEWLAV